MGKKKEVILSLRNVKKYYKLKSKKMFEAPSFLKAVDGIDIDIYKGETFGIVGESGCGKSTVGQMMVNLLRPTDGEITYDRHVDMVKGSILDNKNLKQNVQIIFQDPYSSLNPKKKIGWLLREPLVIHNIGMNKQNQEKMVRKMIKTVGLDESYLDKYPNELSGGQRQRVSIAIALILKPKFIVADESVSALDVSIQAQILNLMQELQKEMGLTYVFISHDLNVVHYISDRIGVMYLGKFVEVGDVDEIYNNPMHPYTQALLSAIPDLEDNGRQKIVLEGDVPSPINTKDGCAFATRCRYAMERCHSETPELQEVGGRQVRCHLFDKAEA